MSCLDNRLFVERFPPELRRERVLRQQDASGGPAGMAAQTIVSLGGRAGFWGRRGADASGDRNEQMLRAAGVDTSYYRSFDGAQSPRCECFIRPDGERYLFPFWSEGLPADPSWLPLDRLAQADAVLIGGRWPEAALVVAREARRLGKPLILDFDRDTAETWELVRLATHAVADEDLASAAGGPERLIGKLTELRVWAAVTLGERGVVWAQGALPAFEVRAVDTTGAGDVFHGAFALAMAERRSEPEALRFASAAAAVRCATGRAPQPEEVREMLRNSTPSASESLR
jgi:sulfofructose kinase